MGHYICRRQLCQLADVAAVAAADVAADVAAAMWRTLLLRRWVRLSTLECIKHNATSAAYFRSECVGALKSHCVSKQLTHFVMNRPRTTTAKY